MPAKPTPVLLLLLCAVTAIGPGSMQIFPPVLPNIRADLGASAATAQLAISAATFAIAGAMLIYGPLSDRFGRKPVLLAGLAAFALGSVATAIAQSGALFVFGRIAQAAGGAAGMVLATAAVRDLFDKERSAEVMAYLMVVMGAAPMVAPSIGDAMASAMGWRAIFWAGAILGVVLFAAVGLRLTETLREKKELPDLGALLAAYAALWRNRDFRRHTLFVGFTTGVFYAFFSGAPYAFAAGFGEGAPYGLWFMLAPGAFMTGNLIAGRITRKLGLEPMIALGSSICLVGCALGLAATLFAIASPLTMFGAMAVTGIGQGLCIASAMSGAVSADPDRAGAAAGLAAGLQMAMCGLIAQGAGMAQAAAGASPASTQIAMIASALAATAIALSRPRRARV